MLGAAEGISGEAIWTGGNKSTDPCHSWQLEQFIHTDGIAVIQDSQF